MEGAQPQLCSERKQEGDSGRSARVGNNIVYIAAGVGHFCWQRGALPSLLSQECFMVGRYQITPVKCCPRYALLHTANSGTGILVFLQQPYCLSCPKQ